MPNIFKLFKKETNNQNQSVISKKNITIASIGCLMTVAALIIIGDGSLSVNYKEIDRNEEIERTFDLNINQAPPPKTKN
ncbi:MAG: hypothetical protein ACFBSE_06870 [Prochloraceae cyanobacterium]